MANVLLCPADKKKKNYLDRAESAAVIRSVRGHVTASETFSLGEKCSSCFFGTFRSFWIWIFFYPIMAVDEDEKKSLECLSKSWPIRRATLERGDTGTLTALIHWNTFRFCWEDFFWGRATQFNTRRRRHSLGADTQTTGGSSFAAGRFVVRTTHKTDRSHAPCHQWQPSVLFHLPAHRGGYFGCDFIGRLINQMPLIGARFKGSNLHTFA